MREPRFFCPDLAPGIVQLSAAESQHLRASLRLRPGDIVVLFDGAGRFARATLMSDSEWAAADGGQSPQGSRPRGATRPPGCIAPREHVKFPGRVAPPEHVKSPGRIAPPGRDRAWLRIERVEEAPLSPHAQYELALLVAACKGERLAWMAEKCAELGVTRLLLVDFERSVVRTGPSHIAKLGRIAIEACKQCGRNRLPRFDAGLTLAQAVAAWRSAASEGALLVAAPDATAPTLACRLSESGDVPPQRGAAALHAACFQKIAIVVGPEGGLSPAELAWLDEKGCQRVRLAEHVLRVETAALVAAAQWAGWRESMSNPPAERAPEISASMRAAP